MKIFLGLLLALSVTPKAFAFNYNCLVKGKPMMGTLSVNSESGDLMLTYNSGTRTEVNRSIAKLNADGTFKEFTQVTEDGNFPDAVKTQVVIGNKIIVKTSERYRDTKIKIKLGKGSKEISRVTIVTRLLDDLKSFDVCRF